MQSTALHGAVCQGFTKCVKMLLQAPGIAVNETDQAGRTPIGLAANRGSAASLSLLLKDSRINVNVLDNKGTPPLLHACIHVRTAMSNMGACDGRFDDHTDPIRGLVLLLRSRRVSAEALDHTIDRCKKHHPSERQVSLDEAGGKPLDDWQLMARHVLPILQAEAKGKKRWCAWCCRVTPDQDLLLCGGCQQVGYCDRVCCQKRGWGEGEHEDACAGMAAEAAAAKAAKAEGKDAGSDGNGGDLGGRVKKIKPNVPCPCGSKKKYKKCCGAN